MSKILCLPDIHGRKFWRKAIDNNVEKVDKIIFLGDYLDPYQDEISKNPDLMECKDFIDVYNLLNMIKDIISLKENEPNKYILLTGNHTDSYIWSRFAAASRTDYENWELYHKLFLEKLNLFNFVWIENDVIFSHAGISEGWAYEFLANYMQYDESALECSLVRETAEVLRDTPLKDFNNAYIRAISNVSYKRYGSYQYGSCEWADILEHIDNISGEGVIKPKGEDGIFQIFGHTQLKKPVITDKWACLDCRKGFIVDTLTHEITEC